jgi:hypothetical protein
VSTAANRFIAIGIEYDAVRLLYVDVRLTSLPHYFIHAEGQHDFLPSRGDVVHVRVRTLKVRDIELDCRSGAGRLSRLRRVCCRQAR